MKDVFYVQTIFKNFYTMVRTQFLEAIKIFRGENGKEYFNIILGDFSLKVDIVHQSLWNYSPQ